MSAPVESAARSAAPPAGAGPGGKQTDTEAEAEVRALTERIESGSADASTYELRASYLIALGRLDEAEKDLSQLDDPARADVLHGDIAAAQGRFREAADHYEAAYVGRAGTSLARKLGRLYVRLGSFHPEDIEHVRTTLDGQFEQLRGTPDWIPWVTFLHERYAASGAWEQEIELLRRISTVNPPESNPRLGLWLTDAYLASGAIDAAEGVIRKMRVNSGHPAVLDAIRHMARVLVRAGENSRAAAYFETLAGVSGQPGDTLMVEMLEAASQGSRFVPLERVGTGAAAEVWKAYDLIGQDYIALKILHASLASDSATRSELKQEYEVMVGSLSPRLARAIPGTLELDRFAMDLLDESLVDRLELPEHESGLPMREAVDVAREVAEGIEYLHARGVVFQDLSPQNILFQQGHVKLVDFGGGRGARPQELGPGIASPGATGSGLGAENATDANGTEGTENSAATVAKVAYASPEQCSLLMGDVPDVVDGRSDIYSLGVVLYQMLTGRLPFEGPDQAVLHAHLYSQPIPPLVFRPAIGQDLNRIVLRAMARDPRDRFSVPAEFFDAVREAVID